MHLCGEITLVFFVLSFTLSLSENVLKVQENTPQKFSPHTNDQPSAFHKLLRRALTSEDEGDWNNWELSGDGPPPEWDSKLSYNTPHFTASSFSFKSTEDVSGQNVAPASSQSEYGPSRISLSYLGPSSLLGETSHLSPSISSPQYSTDYDLKSSFDELHPFNDFIQSSFIELTEHISPPLFSFNLFYTSVHFQSQQIEITNPSYLGEEVNLKANESLYPMNSSSSAVENIHSIYSSPIEMVTNVHIVDSPHTFLGYSNRSKHLIQETELSSKFSEETVDFRSDSSIQHKTFSDHSNTVVSMSSSLTEGDISKINISFDPTSTQYHNFLSLSTFYGRTHEVPQLSEKLEVPDMYLSDFSTPVLTETYLVSSFDSLSHVSSVGLNDFATTSSTEFPEYEYQPTSTFDHIPSYFISISIDPAVFSRRETLRKEQVSDPFSCYGVGCTNNDHGSVVLKSSEFDHFSTPTVAPTPSSFILPSDFNSHLLEDSTIPSQTIQEKLQTTSPETFLNTTEPWLNTLDNSSIHVATETIDVNVTEAQNIFPSESTMELTKSTLAENFWIKTIIEAEPSHWSTYIWDDLPRRIAKAYFYAYFKMEQSGHSSYQIHHSIEKRSEPKDIPMEINATLIGWSVNLSTKHTELWYTLTKNNIPVYAVEAAAVMKSLSKEEVENELGFPVVVGAEPFAQSSKVEYAFGQNWAVLIALSVTGISVALLILGTLAYFRCFRKPEHLLVVDNESPLPSSPAYGQQNVQQMLQEGVMTLNIQTSGNSKNDASTITEDNKRPLPNVPGNISNDSEPKNSLKRSSKRLKTILDNKRNGSVEGINNMAFEMDQSDDEGRRKARSSITDKYIQPEPYCISAVPSVGYFDHVPNPDPLSESKTLPSQASLAQIIRKEKHTQKKRHSNKVSASPPESDPIEADTKERINVLLDETMALASSRNRSKDSRTTEGLAPKVVWTIYKNDPEGKCVDQDHSNSEGKQEKLEALFEPSLKHPSNLDYTVQSAERSYRPLTAPPPELMNIAGSSQPEALKSAWSLHGVDRITQSEAVKDELNVANSIKVKEPSESVIKAIKEELKKFNTSLPGTTPESNA